MKQKLLPHLLFYTRLLLYLAVVSVPFFHPAILVPYDASSIGLWFVIVPAMMFLAFYLSPPLLKIRFWLLISLGFLLTASVVAAGFTLDTLGLLGVGALSFVLTVLVFKTEGKGRVVAALEIFFSGALYYAFLNFSRSSEEVAAASAGILKLLFIVAVLTFIVHAVVLFAASFPRTLTGKGKRNLFILLGVLAPAAVAVALLLPVDFIRHEVRINPLEEELERQINPLEGDFNSPFDGNLQGRDKKLQGLSEEQWKNLNLRRRGTQGGRQRQYSVMVVATGARELYLGEKYFGKLDPVGGLLASEHEPLNELSTLRLIETWQNPVTGNDSKRIKARAEIYSTLKERFFAYRPVSFTPTIKDPDMNPFQYEYEGIFDITTATEDDRLLLSRPLNSEEKAALAQEIEVSLTPEAIKGFRRHLDKLLEPGMSSYEKVLAILNGWHTFQYELGYDERVHVQKILDFVLETKRGDCTEFANATAILSRLAGVPSRVVTGFLASRGLQLPMHTYGLMYLQEQYDTLRRYSIDELLLVTTAHRHAWAQVYIAPFGWIDVEATAYAIPPPPEGDANESPLVLPKRGRVAGKPEEAPPFPWLTLLVVVLIVAGGVFVVLYAVSWIRRLVLEVVARSNSRLGLSALRRLLLIKLIIRGYPYKPPSRTMLDYARDIEELRDFAATYTELRYRQKIDPEEAGVLWRTLRRAYTTVNLTSRRQARKGGGIFREIFSLEGYRY